VIASPMRRVGIQGGPGSFNEVAALANLPDHGFERFDLVYAKSTAEVLDAIEAGTIDAGQFALFNSYAGFYTESLAAVGAHLFRPIASYSIDIRHVLMACQTATIRTIARIITHPAVLEQCVHTIAKRLPHALVEAGREQLIDPTAVAAALAAGTLPPDVATITSEAVAAHFGLAVLDHDLQDMRDNRSTFVLVRALQ